MLKCLSFLSLFVVLIGRIEARPQVYDCFLFCHEIEILDMRLHEMDDVVDKFVIVESVETFRGNPKPLFFAENADRFEKFAHKIIHVVNPNRAETPHPMRREIWQRDYILNGLVDCDPDDIVLISDVDEIVRASEMHKIVDALTNREYPLVGVLQEFHTHFLNTPFVKTWRGTVAGRYEVVKKRSPQALRVEKDWVPAVATGWHFSSQGGIDMVLYKLQSYSHWEDDTPENLDKTKHDYERSDRVPVIPVDESFPRYMIENEEYLAALGYIYRPWLEEGGE